MFTFAILMMMLFHFSWKIRFAVCLAPVASAFFFPDVRCYARQDNTWQAPINSMNIIEHIQNIIWHIKMLQYCLLVHTLWWYFLHMPVLHIFISLFILNIYLLLRKGLRWVLLWLEAACRLCELAVSFRASPSWMKLVYSSILLSDWALKDELEQV